MGFLEYSTLHLHQTLCTFEKTMKSEVSAKWLDFHNLTIIFADLSMSKRVGKTQGIGSKTWWPGTV